MLRFFLATVLFACTYFIVINNGRTNFTIQPAENLLKIRSEVSDVVKRLKEQSLRVEKEKSELLDELIRKSSLEYELRWSLYYSDNNARLLKQHLFLANGEQEEIKIDSSYHFSYNMSALLHPNDEEIVDMAEDIVQRIVFDRTYCKCPHLEEHLDCIDLPEFSYFGTVCEPILWIPEILNQPFLTYPGEGMLPSSHGICFALPHSSSQLPTTYLLKFRDVHVDPMSGVIFDRNKNAAFDNFQMKSLWSDVQTKVRGVIKIKKAISFVQIWGGSYYHYLNEFFTRISFARDFLLDNQDVKILLHASQPFVNESLGLLGISTDRILPSEGNLSPGIFYHIQELYYVVSLPSPGFSAYRELLQQLHKITIPMDQPNKDYLILVNDNPVVRAIDNYESLKLAIKDSFPHLSIKEHSNNYPLSSTINLWNSAKIVIGAHGESLTNLVWCSPNTTVIEFLHTKQETYGHYYWIANSMDLDYWVVPVLNATMHSNYTVPIQKVLNILQKTQRL